MVSQAARRQQLDPEPIETSRATMELRFAKVGRAKILQQKWQVFNQRKGAAAPREEWRDVPMAEDDGGDGAGD